MPTLTDILTIDAHVDAMKELLGTLEKHIQKQDNELSCFTVALYQDAIEKMRSAVEDVTCESCNRPAVICRKVGNFCAQCGAGWFDCDRCSGDLALADVHHSTDPDDPGLYHGACVPYRGCSTEED